MHTICLKDNWTLTVLGKNVYDIPETPIETKVPSTVYGTLLEKGLIPDPFYRDNELDALKLMENDFAYETTIEICFVVVVCVLTVQTGSRGEFIRLCRGAAYQSAGLFPAKI